MRSFQVHDLYLSTLAPIHIGCAEDYVPTNYVIDEQTLFAFDSAANTDSLPEQARQRLLGLVSDKPGQETIQRIQQLFYQNREALMTRAHHFLPVAAGVAELYQKRIGQTAQHESGGKKVTNRLEIERTFYNPTDQLPTIPGSSLKGAIRTALLNRVNNSAGLEPEERELLKKQREVNRPLQQRLFEYKNFENDPMRLLHLSDARWAGSDELNPSEIRFALDKAKKPRQAGPRGQITTETRGPYQLLETIPALRYRAFACQLLLHTPDDLVQQTQLPASLRWPLPEIADACNAFYRPLLEAELDLLQQNSYAHSEWQRQIRQLLDSELSRALDAGQAFLLRVGRHSGAEAVTLNGVRSIKIMLGKNKDTGRQNQAWEAQARTIWLAADHQGANSGMYPFGWMLIELNPEENTLTGVRSMMGKAVSDRRDWLARQREKLAELSEKQARLHAQQQQREQAERQRQEAEAEHQRLLEAMTAEERELQALKDQFEKDKSAGIREAGGVLSNQTSELINKASNWDRRYRQQVADLAETIYAYLGWGKGKRKQERRAKLQALREKD